MCVFFFSLFFCLLSANGYGQAPRFFGSPPAATTINNNTKPADSPVDGAKVPPQDEPVMAEPEKKMGVLYNPSMDNHLKAPETGQEIGLFGKPIKDVESYMRFLGAKNHSYAFGKYSRMVLSVYLVTLYFDRERKLGGFAVEPRLPYKVIGPDARKYFLEVFVGNNNLSQFESQFTSNKLELRYLP